MGLGLRFVAQIIDAIVVIFLFWMIGANIAGMAGGTTDSGFELEGGPALIVILLSTIAAILYFALLEAFWNGQTLGKKLVRIKVTSEDGTPCSFNQALVRNVLRLVDAFAFYLVGAILVLASAKKQRLGDRVAHTIVVKVPKGMRKPAPAKEKKSSVKFSMGRSDYVD